jgi:predicted Zn-dependent peptidase
MLTENLTAIPSGEPIDLPTSGLNRPEKRNHQIYKDRIQYLIARATVSPEIIPNNFSQIFLLENLLGKGPGSEMWKLRAEEGLAYLVDSFAEVNPSEGIFMIYLTTSPDKQGRARLRLRQLLTALYQTGLDEQSLEIHKNHASADWLRLIESKNRKTFYLAFFEALGLGHEFLNRIAADIKEVQLQDFYLFIKKILNPDRLVECIIGPGDQSDTTSRKPPA